MAPVTDTTRSSRSSRSVLVPAAVWSTVALVATVVIVVVALSTADGVVQFDDNSYLTEFIDGTVLQLGWLVLGAFVAAARHSAWVAAAGVLGVVTVHVLTAAEVVRRYGESGWGDGLEAFAFVYPLQMFFGGAIAVAVGVALGRTQRRSAAALMPPRPPG